MGANLTYSVGADRSISVGTGTPFVGTMLADGTMAVLTAASGSPALLVGVKKGSGFSAASATGAWGFAQYTYDPSPMQSPMPAFGNPVPAPRGFSTYSGTITFDGVGGATVSANTNLDGMLSTQPGANLTYTVAADGALNVSGGSPMTGSLVAGGNVAVLTRSGGQPSLLVAVKKGSGFSNASVAGPWAFGQYRYESNASQPSTPNVGTPVPAPRGFTTLAGTITFDGVGAATLSGTQNQDGTVTAAGNLNLSYSVTADGTVTVTGTSTVTGTLAAGGNVVVLTSTGTPFLIVGIKK